MSISRVQDEMASVGIEGPPPSSFILKLFQMTNEAPDDIISVSFYQYFLHEAPISMSFSLSCGYAMQIFQ
jgi:hypothetical protein